MRHCTATFARLAAGLLLFGGGAWAGEAVFTDAGWYRVEGSAPTPEVNSNSDALTVVPAAPPAPATAPSPETSEPSNEPMPAIAPQPPCLAERGALTRRILSLHGLEVSRTEISDAALGSLGGNALGAPGPFSSALSVDPDLNLAMGALPIPPSAANWDTETRQDFDALTACESGE